TEGNQGNGPDDDQQQNGQIHGGHPSGAYSWWDVRSTRHRRPAPGSGHSGTAVSAGPVRCRDCPAPASVRQHPLQPGRRLAVTVEVLGGARKTIGELGVAVAPPP